MKTNLDFLSEHIIERKEPEILRIEKDLIYILGVEFPILVDQKGSFIKIKEIDLDALTSTKLTYQMWSLNFLSLTLQRSIEQVGVPELRKRIVKLIISTLGELTQSCSLQDVILLVDHLEEERNCIKNKMLEKPKAKTG